MSIIEKLTIVGGGSSYTPELVDGLVQNYERLQINDLVLYDIDPERVEIVGSMVKRQFKYADLPTRVSVSTARADALEGAEMVVSQIRVGKMAARVLDEKIPLKYNILGQETTGPGGTFKALRTIPPSIDIARDVSKYCPDAWFINFTNPSGIVTEALFKYSDLEKIVGLCDNPTNSLYTIADALGVGQERVFLEWIGMNHVNWIRRVLLDGRDVTEKIMSLIEAGAHERLNYRFSTNPNLIRALGVLPNYYLKYYYHHPENVREQLSASRTRGEIVLEIEKKLFEKYRDPDQMTKPAELSQRGGAMYSKAAMPLIISLVQDRRDVQIVVTRNQGAIPDLPADAAVEVACLIGAHGAKPLYVGELPSTIRGLAQQVKAWEGLTVEAGATGSRGLALAALVTNPLVPSYAVAKDLLEEMLTAHKHNLPQFFPPD